MAPLEPKRHCIYAAIDPSNPSSELQNSARCKTVIITGAGRGIGRSIALSYAKAGASLIVLASRTLPQLEVVEKDINGISKDVVVIKQPCDVTDESSVEQLISVAVAASNPDTAYVLVNNAGTLETPVVLSKSDPKEWCRTWDVNVKGTYLPTRFLLDNLSPKSSSPHYIINISSIGSRLSRSGLSSYQPSKTAVNRFTQFLALEHATTHNLVTFAVHPGGVLTKLARDGLPTELHHLLNDTGELMGGFSVWLGSGKCDWANGLYLECNWDVDDILQKKEEVINGKLWQTVVTL